MNTGSKKRTKKRTKQEEKKERDSRGRVPSCIFLIDPCNKKTRKNDSTVKTILPPFPHAAREAMFF
jgi:hypothetical protein